MAQKADQKQSFAKRFDELQKIASEVETDDADLEQSIPKFRRGMELARDLLKRLKDLENEVEEIRRDFADVGKTDLKKSEDNNLAPDLDEAKDIF